jgi:hypothetical protein
MRLTSEFPYSVIWRTFNSDDTVYIIGNWEGVLRSKQFADINHPSGRFQMELKLDNGTWVLRPGEVFRNTDRLVLKTKVMNGVAVGDLVKA